jgi:hypothetical protein
MVDLLIYCTLIIFLCICVCVFIRLKAAMHGASMGEEWATNNRAEEEAGIIRLDSMATSEQRLQTLNAVRLVSSRVEYLK